MTASGIATSEADGRGRPRPRAVLLCSVPMHDIAHQLTIAAPQPRVFEAITTPTGISRWWTTDVQLAGTTLDVGLDGGAVRLRFTADDVDPPVLAHLTCTEGPDEWPGTQLAFRLRPDPAGGGTILRFWHGGWEYEDGILPSCSFDWAMRLDSLRRYLETGTGSPAT